MPKREVDYKKENKMVVSNDYVKAIHPDRMSLNAMKLFRLVVTQCRLKDEEFFEYDFKITDLAEAFSIDRHNLYKETQAMCINMMQMVLLYGEGNPQKSWKMKHIFDECSYEDGSGTIKVKLHPDMTDLFLKLKRDFTQIPIASVLLMRSKYSIRMFEILCEKMRNCMPYADTATEVTLTLEEIRIATGTDKKKTYNRISNLKDKVVKPSLAEIETAADWKIICTDLKQGRTVTGFRLEVWGRNGWEYIQDCKEKGILPNRGKYGNDEEQIPGQITLFDYINSKSKERGAHHDGTEPLP